MTSRTPQEREPEPDAETAWAYAQAYFDYQCTETAFGVVQRPSFEVRLRSQSRLGQLSTADQDPSWYALRNIVYAGGCRQLSMRRHPSRFRFDESPSWKYFNNAFSVYSELLYCRTNLLAVQALAAMSFYVEGIGTPSLEYMLCLSALKLAESKGLHRKPSSAWNLSESAVQYRSNLWWAIYIYERNIAFRSGRPVSIDDDDITCQLPTARPEGDSGNQDFFIACARKAQLFSLIYKRIRRLKNSTQSLQEVAATISELHNKVEGWYSSLPVSLKLDAATGSFPSGTHPVHGLFLHFSYHASLMAIHSVLVHPWNAVPLDHSQNSKEDLQNQVLSSTRIVAEASRNIIRNLKHVRVGPAAPKTMAYVIPLQAMVSLFVHLLQYPEYATVDSDIALMYTVSGHLGYVEFACADVEFQLAREMANLACMKVSMARGPGEPLKSSIYAKHQQRQIACAEGDSTGGASAAFDLPILDSDSMFNIEDLDDERWGTLLWWPESSTDLEIGLTASSHGGMDFDIPVQ
ncbi:hypothetical protein H2204_013986 [Knufia peltigerae]|uniref:Xylanolytic transcriptional activator regulatory domain-containing protein n=1 Tax=Knufia peltigerae TaxID=1002370 RepID=A0AA38XNB2_9EURO|nr:hypothetical protein H2204_013986 [Knufia peltigerae]